jgi:hypothetical protein
VAACRDQKELGQRLSYSPQRSEERAPVQKRQNAEGVRKKRIQGATSSLVFPAVICCGCNLKGE